PDGLPVPTQERRAVDVPQDLLAPKGMITPEKAELPAPKTAIAERRKAKARRAKIRSVVVVVVGVSTLAAAGAMVFFNPFHWPFLNRFARGPAKEVASKLDVAHASLDEGTLQGADRAAAVAQEILGRKPTDPSGHALMARAMVARWRIEGQPPPGTK